MRVIKYNMMLKNRDNTLVSIIDKDIAECRDYINQHIQDEYGLVGNVNNTKLYDIIRGKTKKSMLNQIIIGITQKQYSREELEALRNAN